MLWLLKPSVPLSSYRQSRSRGASTLHFSQFTYDAFILTLPLTAASPSPVAITPPLRVYCISWAQFIDGVVQSKKENCSGLSKMPILDVCGFWISKINLIISWIYPVMETQFKTLHHHHQADLSILWFVPTYALPCTPTRSDVFTIFRHFVWGKFVSLIDDNIWLRNPCLIFTEANICCWSVRGLKWTPYFWHINCGECVLCHFAVRIYPWFLLAC